MNNFLPAYAVLQTIALQAIGHPLTALVLSGLAIYTAAIFFRFFVTSQGNTLQNKSRFQTLDAFRGLLALGVMISHIPITWSYLTRGTWVFLTDSNFYAVLGDVCVTFFFMATGFLFWGKLLHSRGKLDFRVFILGRIFRIYPLYLSVLAVVIMLGFGLQGWQHKESITATLRQCLRWCTFVSPDINQYVDTGIFIARVEWSLRYEWLFYAALPISAFIFRSTKHHLIGLIAGVVILGGISFLDPLHRIAPKHCASFFGGIIAAYFISSSSPYILKIQAFMRQTVIGGATWILLFILLFFVSNIHSLGAFCLMTFIFCGIVAGNTLAHSLTFAPILWLGEISYSVYLVHGLVLWFFCQYIFHALSPTNLDPVIFLLCSAATSIGAVCVASATYLFIERKGMTIGKLTIERLSRKS